MGILSRAHAGFSRTGGGIIAVPIAIIAIMIDIYLLINGATIFGSGFQTSDINTNVLELYLLMDGAVLFIIPIQKTAFINIKAPDLIYWVPAFFLTGIIIGNTFHPLVPVHSAQYEIAALLFEIFVVTFSETWIFLGVLQTYLMRRNVRFPYIWQAVIFGLFHYTAYGENIISMAQAMAFGLIVGLIYYAAWTMKKPDIGLTLAWGIHAGWNVALITVIFILFG